MAHFLTHFYAQEILGDILEYGSAPKPLPKEETHKRYITAAVVLLEKRGAIKNSGNRFGVRYQRGEMNARDIRQLWRRLRGEGDRSYLLVLRDGSRVL